MTPGRLSSRHLLLAFMAIFLATAILFISFPALDLDFTALFFDQAQGFYLKQHPLVQFSYRYNNYIVTTTALTLIFILVLAIKNKRAYFGLDKKAASFLLLVMVLGPGLVVNNVFKNQWDRARPDKIAEFGGEKRFTPAFVISDQCQKNCSFVSGHSAAIYFFAAFFLIMNGRRKWWILAASILAGSLVGLGRIVQGDHFLSDVIFSFFIVMSVAILLYWVIYIYKPGSFSN
jgi:lipid A 4'-phosphatase